MSYQMTLNLTSSATSLQASAAGLLLSSSPVGPKTSPSGQEASPAFLSAWQAKEQGLLTSGTYGQRSFGSSASVNLQSSLVSRLVQRLPLSGGISWHLIWKTRTTPRLRQICLLRASGLHIGETGCSGWGTPTVQDGNGRDRHNQRDGSIRLSLLGQARAAEPATWTTPTVNDSKNNGSPSQMSRKTLALNCQVQGAAWSTPTASDGKNLRRSPQALQHRREKKYGLALPEQTVSLIPGQDANGSTASMESNGQLNPAFACWLMGFPDEWLHCAASAMRSSRS